MGLSKNQRVLQRETWIGVPGKSEPVSNTLFQHKTLIQVVDMRWGVRDEMTNEHMTTELCMRELASCQQLSIGPEMI